MYFYNGGGVAVGDVNGDGLQDIYFTSNQEDNKLYLNKGDFKFEDITESAGVAGFKGWTTGVTMADVNNDGRLDIYVGYLGDYEIYKGKNQLFINEGNDEKGNPRFSDRAMQYGLDLVGFATQATFFDYDRDGDLDMFMLNHSLHQNGTFGKSGLRKTNHPLAGDKLLKNENGRFVDVTSTSGIYGSVIGYGLGVVVSDVNLDGWPDIYVGNDFHENDYLYINQGNGTFKESLEEQMMHTSRYTMGVDFGDINNDAFPDLVAMDMLPADPLILKASAAEDVYDVYNFKIDYGFNHQFSRNVLQINNHDGTFSDIGLYAGIHATDWSWSTLFADFDLDGFKDIFVSNGILRRSNDLDYINFITVDSVQMKMEFDMSERELKYIEKMPRIKLANFLFRNNHDSTFTNQAVQWGLEQPSYSNGTAYADFDNDGDLDLVINNIEDEAFLYENRIISKKKKDEREHVVHYLKIVCEGNSGNKFGLGTKVFLYRKGAVQMQEVMATRGYQSAVDTRIVFGLGSEPEVDSLRIVWPDGKSQKLLQIKADQVLTVKQSDATTPFDYSIFHRSNPIFVEATQALDLNYIHKENKFVEFNREALIPHMMSAEGPGVAVGDINNDGLQDLFLGNAKWQKSQLLIQTKDGKFTKTNQQLFINDSTYEDVDATFFDADKDGDQDLFVVSGGNEFVAKSAFRKPRLYINDGKGNMTSSTGLPELYLTGSCVSVNDIDHDGDLDIFLGTRTTPWRYGIKPDSYILINDGKGKFEDQTSSIAPALKQFGFVKKASWADIDKNGFDDLIIAAEWSTVSIFMNDRGVLKPMILEGSGLENTQGWWNIIEPVDIDKDGDIDLVGGNLGLNSKLHASQDQPVRMYVSDFDKNDSTDQILTHYMLNEEYPFYTRDEMTKQMPFLKKKYLSYHKFAETRFADMFPKETLANAQQYIAYTFESCVFENLGNGKFRKKVFPKAAQFSTVNTLLAEDFNHDGHVDLLLAGNFYPINIQMGRYDASYGCLLEGDGKGNFKAVPSYVSGFSVRGETRHLEKISVQGKTYYLAIRNNDTIKAYLQKQ
jgi:hypothetical protein